MGFVYVLKAEHPVGWGKSLIKIGLTGKRDVSDRTDDIAAEWQHDRRIKVIRLHSWKVRDEQALESTLHKEFSKYSKEQWGLKDADCNGDSEWFVMPDRVVNELTSRTYGAESRVLIARHFIESVFQGAAATVFLVAATWLGFYLVQLKNPTIKTIVPSEAKLNTAGKAIR